MLYHHVDFIKSVSADGEWPISNYPEFVLAGRSNVGKSSFINAILNRKNMAFVGKTPGKTQLLNFFEVDHKFMMVDVPGYGYAARSRSKLQDFGTMMEDYFAHRQNLKALFLIVDLRHKPTPDDIDMIEFAKAHHMATFVVATKHDKCKNSELHKLKMQVADTLNISSDQLILFSSITKKGVDEVYHHLDRLIETPS